MIAPALTPQKCGRISVVFSSFFDLLTIYSNVFPPSTNNNIWKIKRGMEKTSQTSPILEQKPLAGIYILDIPIEILSNESVKPCSGSRRLLFWAFIQ